MVHELALLSAPRRMGLRPGFSPQPPPRVELSPNRRCLASHRLGLDGEDHRAHRCCRRPSSARPGLEDGRGELDMLFIDPWAIGLGVGHLLFEHVAVPWRRRASPGCSLSLAHRPRTSTCLSGRSGSAKQRFGPLGPTHQPLQRHRSRSVSRRRAELHGLPARIFQEGPAAPAIVDRTRRPPSEGCPQRVRQRPLSRKCS